MRELLRSEGWTPSGVLTGLDDGDPERLFFHDAPPQLTGHIAHSHHCVPFGSYEEMPLS